MLASTMTIWNHSDRPRGSRSLGTGSVDQPYMPKLFVPLLRFRPGISGSIGGVGNFGGEKMAENWGKSCGGVSVGGKSSEGNVLKVSDVIANKIILKLFLQNILPVWDKVVPLQSQSTNLIINVELNPQIL